MWIELDDSLIEGVQEASNQQCMTLDTIASSAHFGRHALYGSVEVMDWLQRQPVSPATKAICKKIKNSRPELKAIRTKLAKKLIIGFYDGNIESNNGEIWRVSLDYLIGNPFSLGVILTENHCDAEIYKIAADHYKRDCKLLNYPTKLSVQGGGGNQIHPTFVNLVTEKLNFCIVITDTDKDYPSANSNETSRKCARVAAERSWISFHMDVPARELENVIPLNLLSDAIHENKGAVDLKNGINQIDQVNLIKSELLLYSDFKLGTTRYWASGGHGNLDRSNYWRCLLAQSKKCGNNECEANCVASSKDKCKSFMVSSLGENIADIFLDYAKRTSPVEQYKRVKTSANADQWFSMGKAVFEWGIALPVSRS